MSCSFGRGPAPLVIALAITLVACSTPEQTTSPSTTTLTPSVTPPPAVSAIVLGNKQPPIIAAIQAEQERRQQALVTPPHILLRPGLEGRLNAAQEAAANDGRLQRAARTAAGERLLAEVMSVSKTRAGDVPPALASQCPPGSCLKVVVYVYPTNTSLTSIVDDRGEVIDVQSLADAQPEIPAELANLATQIAISSPETAQALGLPPDVAMASTTFWKSLRS